MSALSHPVPPRQRDSAVALVEELLRSAGPQSIAIQLWNGVNLRSHPGMQPEFTIVLNAPGALRGLLSAPTERSLGEAYIFGDCDLQGDLEAAVRFGTRLVAKDWGVGPWLHFRALLNELPTGRPHDCRVPSLKGKLHSLSRDQAAIHYHYDISNDFYALFLDRRMVYSAAHFAQIDQDLDSAQQLKLDRICRLLELRPGERLLDIGCGWGGLIIYAAQTFGVEALGITLSERQAELARERIRLQGLEDRCRVEVRDYRDFGSVASFDKITSVGMVEHVGARNLHSYFQTIRRLLARDGALLNSGIARPHGEPAHRKGSFTESYVFPDGELETIPETLKAAEEAGLEIRAAENWRQDYALTLRHWVRRLENHAEEARRATDDVTYRIWRLYMSGSAARFAAGELFLLSALFSPAPLLR